MADVISRADAREQGLTHFFTGVPCKHGHLERRFVSSKQCMECNRLRQAVAREDPAAKRAAADRTAQWRAENPGYNAAYLKQWREDNPEKFRQGCDAWAERNPEKHRASKRRAEKKWRRNNPERLRLHARSRSRRVSKQTPKWVDRAAIREFYANCPPGYQVDHIVPLNGETVSGLHVLENLQYLTPSENQSKGNRWDPDWLNTYPHQVDIPSRLVVTSKSR